MFTREQFLALTFEEKLKVMELKAKFHAKKTKATAEMKRIPKNGWNDFHKYHYARESDVKDQIRPIMAENKLSFSMDLLSNVESPAGKYTRSDVKMVFSIIDVETGYFEEFTHDGSAVDSGDKGIYKAYSNTIKYALMNYFLIPTGDDVEKDSPEVKSDQQQQQKRTGTAQKSNQTQQQQKPKQTQQTGDKPTWKKVMDAEDVLAQTTGTTKPQIREELQKYFGKIDKYKDLDEEKAVAILDQLNDWISGYVKS